MTALLRLPWWVTLLLSALGSVGSPASLPLPPSPLTCPAGQAVWLRGTAAPARHLAVRFAGRVVGGGVTGPDGHWALTLTARERPGVYPVVVESRDDAMPVAAFTCFVDLPLNATPTASPTAYLGRPAWATLPDETEQAPSPQPATPTATTTTSTPGKLPSSPLPTPTVPCSGFPAPCDAPPTTLTTLTILSVRPHDPTDGELFEYLVLANQGATSHELAGWSVVHGTTGEAYPLPAVSLPTGGVLLVWSGAGVNDPAAGSVFWPAETGRWNPGDQALLRDPQGQTSDTLVVGHAEATPMR